MSRRARNQKHNPLLALATRDITGISLKTIFDNLRNYLLGAVVLKGAMTLLKAGGVDQTIGAIALLASGSLMMANVFQTYLIAYRYHWKEQEQKIENIPVEERLGYKMWCAFLALAIGSSIIYVLYRTIPL